MSEWHEDYLKSDRSILEASCFTQVLEPVFICPDIEIDWKKYDAQTISVISEHLKKRMGNG